MNKRIATLALSLAAFAPVTSHAATTIEGVDALREWNLIVLGDVNSSSEVEGRTFVGGNLTGSSSNFQIRNPAASVNGTPGLTVVGNVLGSTKNLNNGSGAIVGGNVVSGFNLNGPDQTVLVGGTIQNTNVNSNTVISGLASTPGFLDGLMMQRDALIQSLGDLSLTLSGLTPTNMVNITGSKATFDATPDSDGLATFDLTSAELDSFGEIAFNTNGADTVIVNVSGSSVNLNDNFLGNSFGLGESVIWNFHEATNLGVSVRWNGSVLAPFAAGTTSNYIEGSAVFGSLTQNGEMHLPTYNGNYTPPGPPTSAVPEPASWAMMLLGFGAIGGALRFRRRQTGSAALLTA